MGHGDSMSDWEVYALKYGDRSGRTRADSFIFDDNHDAPHAIDYYMWLLRRGEETILVDSGYDNEEGAVRGRPIRLDPAEALAPMGLTPDAIDTLVVTHLHYDHAGGMHLFENAHIHLQEAEMAYATGPCMCHDTLRQPFTAGHVCEAVKRLYSGKLTFHDGSAEIAEGVSVHCIGGHSRGLQAVRVKTKAGHMVLASDATHFYENIRARKPFPIVVDVQDMLDGFGTLEKLASHRDLVVPGHDPLVREVFPAGPAPHISRLDTGPIKEIPG